MTKKLLVIFFISMIVLPGRVLAGTKKTALKKPIDPVAPIVVLANKKPTVSGQVATIDGQLLEVKDSKTKESVWVNTASANFGPVLEFSDIGVGDKVIVVGQEGDGIFLAEKVSDISKPLTLVRLGGRVAGMENGSFRFKTKSFGDVLVRLNDGTVINKDSELVDAAQINNGDYVKVSGRWNVTDRPALRKIEAKGIDVYSDLSSVKIAGKILPGDKKDKYHSFYITVGTEDGEEYTVDMSDAATKNKTVSRKKYYIKEQLEVGDSVEVSGQATRDKSLILADLVINLMNNKNNK